MPQDGTAPPDITYLLARIVLSWRSCIGSPLFWMLWLSCRSFRKEGRWKRTEWNKWEAKGRNRVGCEKGSVLAVYAYGHACDRHSSWTGHHLPPGVSQVNAVKCGWASIAAWLKYVLHLQMLLPFDGFQWRNLISWTRSRRTKCRKPFSWSRSPCCCMMEARQMSLVSPGVFSRLYSKIFSTPLIKRTLRIFCKSCSAF